MAEVFSVTPLIVIQMIRLRHHIYVHLKTGLTSFLKKLNISHLLLWISGDFQYQNWEMYEGWNFNNGNYLFTTDTK